LRTRELEVVVFDDAGGEDPMRSIVGVARVPMDALAQVRLSELAVGLDVSISLYVCEGGGGGGSHVPVNLPGQLRPFSFAHPPSLCRKNVQLRQSCAKVHGDRGEDVGCRTNLRTHITHMHVNMQPDYRL
jgi:hypothetical protein